MHLADSSLVQQDDAPEVQHLSSTCPPTNSDMADPLLPSFWDNAPAYDNASAPAVDLRPSKPTTTAPETTEGSSEPLLTHIKDVTSPPDITPEPNHARAETQAPTMTSDQQTNHDIPIHGVSENIHVCGDEANVAAALADPAAHAQDRGGPPLHVPTDTYTHMQGSDRTVACVSTSV